MPSAKIMLSKMMMQAAKKDWGFEALTLLVPSQAF